MDSVRILVVEDEPAIARGLGDCLRFRGWNPTIVHDGDDGLSAALAGGFDVLVLDAMLPGTDGFAICRAARAETPQVGIIMLTARSGEDDILQGFSAGADDYVCKPFSVAQLLARVDALLRRQQHATAEPGAVDEEWERLSLGPIAVDAAQLQVQGPLGTIDISRRDYSILALLLREQGRIVSRRALLQDVWGYGSCDGVESRSVDMHIVKLRRKLQQCVNREIIITVRGEGYRLAPELSVP